ncbi:T9SS type A sorting domain-containing protein [uncultured Winogradskyella sp.]|uniref:T9SS type A sorting domain-containing protein n=1 Tax=uncultured Winogradskyella sp. TaxID=395353 RepID=UPI00260A9093|nr:T9SS type A sorting domain-containing protein [uncultured Winogradskyella sp.]
MKRFLLFSIIYLVPLIGIAQTFNGNGDGTSWFDPDNWSGDMVPISNGNPVIPSGFTVNQNGPFISVNSITLQGFSVLNTNNQISTTGTSTFGPDSTINVSGNSFGGSGIINAQGTINIPATSAFSGTLTVNNTGVILINGGALQINTGTLNNLPSGTIEIQSDGGNITASNFGIVNNEGLIKKTTTTGSANLQCSLNNDNGTIQVENGTLVIGSSPGGNLTNGTYNVSQQSILDLALTFSISGTLQGNIDGTFNLGTTGLTSIFNIAPNTEAIFDFSGNGSINFVNPTFQGGGTFTNKNEVNLISVASKRIEENTTFNNENTIHISSIGDFVINDGTFNNLPNSVIDMQADMGNITWTNGPTHVLNNEGIIKKTTSSGEARIQVELNNNNGEISVESGTLTFLGTSIKNLIDGTYNVNSNAVFNWTSDVHLKGNISGIIDGDLNWNNDVIVTSPNSATFNFTGSGNFNWTNNALRGGGSLTNNSVLNLTGSGLKKILETTYFQNTNTINFTSSGRLDIADGFLTNFAFALIDLQVGNGSISGAQITTYPFTNNGTIRRSNTAGSFLIWAPTINTGFIELLTGELEFFGTNVFENTNNSYITGIGAIDVPQLTDYINDGTISPGLSLGLLPGTLTIEGNFQSSSASDLLIDINGHTSGTEYDVMQIQGIASEGNAIFEGTIYVTLGFEPSINDEFVIATTTGIISACNLTSPTIASFNGNLFTFDVICRNNNEVVLTVVDPLEVNEFDEEIISIYPNPTKDVLLIDDVKNKIETVEIVSPAGQLVLREKLAGNRISLSQLSKGIYLIRLHSKGSLITKKVIKL